MGWVHVSIIVYRRCGEARRVVQKLARSLPDWASLKFHKPPDAPGVAACGTVWYSYKAKSRGAVRLFHEIARKIAKATRSCVGVVAFGTTAIRESEICP